MPTPSQNQRILIFVDDIYEDLELWYPRLRMIEAGCQVVVAGPQAKQTYRGKHSYPCVSDAAIAEVDAGSFDGVVVPGGFMPDKLRRDSRVLKLVRDFHEAKKLVAAVCHGGWIPISAGVYKGVRVTGSLGIKAQSVGGGGGDGGFSFSGSFGAGDSKNLSFSLGGSAGDANVGGRVEVLNTGDIETFGLSSHGILAQSVGGGGGSGGFSAAGTLTAKSGMTGQVGVAVSVGGAGGDGDGRSVDGDHHGVGGGGVGDARVVGDGEGGGELVADRQGAALGE